MTAKLFVAGKGRWMYNRISEYKLAGLDTIVGFAKKRIYKKGVQNVVYRKEDAELNGFIYDVSEEALAQLDKAITLGKAFSREEIRTKNNVLVNVYVLNG